MKKRSVRLYTLVLFLILVSCQETKKSKTDVISSQEANSEKEKKAILKRLNNETKDAFQRNYEAWTENWVHDPNISKIYINFADSTYSESVGWDEISKFVKTFIEEHPEPEQVPKLLDKINVRL